MDTLLALVKSAYKLEAMHIEFGKIGQNIWIINLPQWLEIRCTSNWWQCWEAGLTITKN